MSATSPEDLHPPSTPTLFEAACYWLKLGFVSFGGPAGQIAIMHQDLVDNKRWISEKRFLHALNYCMLLPGPEAQQLATYIGWLLHRTWGGVIAGTLFVLPSLLILMLLTWLYLVYGHLPAIEGVLYGVKPAVVAIVVFAAWRIGARTLRHRLLWMIAAGAFLGIALLHIPFPAILLLAALVGLFADWCLPQSRRIGHGMSNAGHAAGGTSIDDASPPPSHVVPNWRRACAVILGGLSLWFLVFAALIMFFGWASPLVEMAWFFTKTAFLTFGGAYAALPYIYQGAIQAHGWLSPVQMIDGLALGETTPGPLIMVVAFVGFVGGWNQAALVAEPPLLAAISAACVATYFTFLPSFLFILIGGPFVESMQDSQRLVAPLTAITAAVVGVIFNLAMFFAYHVFWPNGLSMPVDRLSIVVTALSVLLLFRMKLGVVPLILLTGVLGLLYRTLM